MPHTEIKAQRAPAPRLPGALTSNNDVKAPGVSPRQFERSPLMRQLTFTDAATANVARVDPMRRTERRSVRRADRTVCGKRSPPPIAVEIPDQDARSSTPST
jgi:hypothetical protein